MSAELFDRRAKESPTVEAPLTPGAAFAARPRLLQLRDALARAARHLRPARWGEPAVFFFDRKRQAELEAARPAPPHHFTELNELIAAEMPGLLAAVEVRRVARAIEGLKLAALKLAARCDAAKELADLLAVPDDEVFVALAPAERTGVRLHLRGVADVAQLHRLLSRPNPPTPFPHREGGESEPLILGPSPLGGGVGEGSTSRFQFFTPGALRADGSLPTGFAGSEHWLWPTQPLAAVPRIGGERVVLVGPAVVRASLEVEPRFPALKVESELLQTLNPFQVAERLSRLAGRTVPPVAPPEDTAAVARAA